MKRAFGFVDGLARFCSVLGSGLLLVVATAITVNILLRWLIAYPLHFVGDLATLVTAIAIAAAMPLCVLRRGNITVTILGEAVARRSAALRRALDAFGAVVTLVLMSAMAWQLVLYAIQSSAAGSTTLLLRWPTSPFWWAVAAFFVFAAITALFSLIRQTEPPND